MNTNHNAFAGGKLWIVASLLLSAATLLISMSLPEKRKLLWSDEFDYDGTPDPKRWTYDIGDGCPHVCGWGNNELQYYTKNKKNARVENGKLIIEVHREKTGEKNYSSTRLKTTNGGSWKYGYIEVKAKLPRGRGVWPAIWMLPDASPHGGWPSGGEIDIMEHVGYNPGVVYGTVHTGSFNHKKGTHPVDSIPVAGVSEDFHIYALNWTSDKMDFFVDGKLFHSFENNGEGSEAWPFDTPFHLILNVAVGGGWGGKRGVDDSIWPQRMEVDYVRVYEAMTE